jgi:tRNA threonylcarbamoyladenosine biosynthesis protein TsaE
MTPSSEPARPAPATALPPETVVTASAEETMEYGRRLAARMRPPLLVFLYGELGAGKTTLAKGIISGLGAAREDEVTSPTFTLVHEFRCPAPLATSRQPLVEDPERSRRATGPRVFHIDLYRIEGATAFDSLGLDDLFATPAIVLVEWPEKWALGTDWPVLRIHLAALEDGRHSIEVFS